MGLGADSVFWILFWPRGHTKHSQTTEPTAGTKKLAIAILKNYNDVAAYKKGPQGYNIIFFNESEERFVIQACTKNIKNFNE